MYQCLYSKKILENMENSPKTVDVKLHWEKFLGTVTRNLVVKIVFNNIFRVEITWSFLQYHLENLVSTTRCSGCTDQRRFVIWTMHFLRLQLFFLVAVTRLYGCIAMNCMHSFLRFVCSDRWKIDITWTAMLPERELYFAITKNWPKYRARVFYLT